MPKWQQSWVVADETVLNTVHRKKIQKNPPVKEEKIFGAGHYRGEGSWL
jgi:hypothetical protein